MIIIGITGPTGAGKTTALNELTKLGGATIDCDAVYHELLEGDIALQNALEQRFGDLQDGSGHIDRKKLGAIVFQDQAALAELNAIAHRAVVRKVGELIEVYRAAGTYTAIAVDAISLFESGLADLCQETLAITAPPDIRVRRIMAREGISEDYARARVKAQNPDEFYTSRCDHTLVNDCDSAADFAARAHALFELILQTDIH